MKKTLIVAAVSALAAGSAFAQSSVTLYGRVNVTGERQDLNGRKIYKEVNNASRWGVKGTEDMGGGLKAGFQLESGFAVDTGAVSGAFFGRQSEVNLSGSFGMVRLGNFQSEAYYATADYVSMHNHDTGPSGDAFWAYARGNTNTNTNKIAYRLPTFVKDLSLEGAVSAGEGTGPRAYDFAANYEIGGLALGLGAQKAAESRQIAVRALYTMGPVILGGYYLRDRNGLAANSFVNSLGDRNVYRLSGAYMMGASEFHLNFGSSGAYSKVANSSAKQFTVGYNYNLSKRTKVYGYFTEVKDGKANLYNAANFGIATTGADTKFSSIAFGVRHNF